RPKNTITQRPDGESRADLYRRRLRSVPLRDRELDRWCAPAHARADRERPARGMGGDRAAYGSLADAHRWLRAARLFAALRLGALEPSDVDGPHPGRVLQRPAGLAALLGVDALHLRGDCAVAAAQARAAPNLDALCRGRAHEHRSLHDPLAGLRCYAI